MLMTVSHQLTTSNLSSPHIPMISRTYLLFYFFFNDTATTEIYTLSLHDALPIWTIVLYQATGRNRMAARITASHPPIINRRSEEHTSELQSQSNLVCRLLLEKKKKTDNYGNGILRQKTITELNEMM